MFGLISIFVVILLGLAVLLWFGTQGIQGLLYNEPVGELHWRGPATAAALTGFLALWCCLAFLNLDPNQPDLPLDTLFRFQTRHSVQVNKFWAVKKNTVTDEEKQIEFQRHVSGDYRDPNNQPWQRADPSGIVAAILIEEGGQKVRFEPRLTAEGKFVETAVPFPSYYEKGGRRVMEQLGQLTVFHRMLWLANILLNLLHLGVWFVCLWLILRFQWLHALMFGGIAWLIATLVLLPMVLDRTQAVARERAGVASPTSQLKRLPAAETYASV